MKELKSFDYAEQYCYAEDVAGVVAKALADFQVYLDGGGDINEADRGGMTALSIAREVAIRPGPGSQAAKLAAKSRATELESWLIARGAI